MWRSLLRGETRCTHKVFDHLLPDDAVLLARQLCDCLRDRINDVIRFIGIDFA